MKKFFVKLFILFFITFIIMCGLEVFVEYRYTKGIDDKKVDLHLLPNRNSDIVIVGNSRVRWQINPEVIEKETGLTTTNVVIDGATKEELAFKLNFYLKYNKAPKYIFLSTDFGEHDDNSLKRKENYLRYFYFTSPYAKDVWAFDSSLSFSNKYIPLVRYSGYYARFVRSVKPIKENSFILGFQEDHTDEIEAITTLRTDTLDMVDFEKNISLLTRNISPKTKVICFTPFNPQVITYPINLDKLEYPYFNTSYLMSRDSEQLFQDAGHLNNKGAQVYTKKIVKYFKKYLN